ncbi:MAG: HEPN domain-containing protein [Phycisphaerae bacterium]|nr:HEPN domain-containing protein [Phycisphaerae bacterium]NUQ48203.1 HEPN domain-containing protein [Phycisphaerae bacterium]
MTPDVRQWLEKAEGDWHTANRELRARKCPNYDATCFHAQQAAEKYMKGSLLQHNASFPRTHDLAALLDLLRTLRNDWELLRADVILLTQYAVFFRYPGRWADKSRAQAAVAACKRVRAHARIVLRVSSGVHPRFQKKPRRSHTSRKK